ncbi:hypothetical protein ACFWPX_29625 [Nocardia sp. NPDC058518]|uniref:hypothetical protein n=1 Tax=Nocardia sp. NPDC058518 TaxID=3346534 RepID=UPI00365EF0BC
MKKIAATIFIGIGLITGVGAGVASAQDMSQDPGQSANQVPAGYGSWQDYYNDCHVTNTCQIAPMHNPQDGSVPEPWLWDDHIQPTDPSGIIPN